MLIELFYVLTGAILALVSLELLWPRVVSAYLNVSVVLIFWLIVGIVVVLMDNKRDKKND